MIQNLFLSVGAMKAGTTWLYDQLKEHPQVYFTPEKEIHYFEQVTGNSNPLSHQKRREKMIQVIAQKNPAYVSEHLDRIQWYLNYGSDKNINDLWYERLFEPNATNPNTYCADFSNLNALLTKSGWDRVKQNCNKLKVIYTMRDPVSRVWSHFKFHMQFIGKGDQIIESSTDNFVEMLGKDWFWNHARYDQCLYRLERFLDQEGLMVLYFEDFRNSPQKTMDGLMNFLEIPKISMPESSSKPVNASKEMQMPEEWRQIVLEKLTPTLEALRLDDRIHDKWIF